MTRDLLGALDRAEADGAVVLLRRRERIFSGGYDLKCSPKGRPRS